VPLEEFHSRNRSASGEALDRLRQAVAKDGNIFDILMDAARVCSLEQVTDAFFEVDGQYRRNV
jgi:methylmalonyl-CoA mutase